MVNLAKGHLSVFRQHFQRTSHLKLLGQFHFNFISSLKARRGDLYLFGPGHMTKMAAMPMYGKNL